VRPRSKQRSARKSTGADSTSLLYSIRSPITRGSDIMSKNVSVIDVSNQASDIEYKLEKASAIIATLQNGIFDTPKMTTDILTDKDEKAHADLQHILLQYNDSQLFVGILLDYVAESRQMAEQMQKDISSIVEKLDTVKSVV
jgi:hypothetical protein